jgi:hypothetical protein
MKLEGLVDLYRSMKSQEIDRYRFSYSSGKALFDVFFFIDESPFVLLFGVKSENFSFEIVVEKGFDIDPRLDRDTYKELCRVLGLEYDPDRPFSPWNFFKEFNENIPNKALAAQKAEPHEVADYRSVAEEADKIYFLGWRDNTKRCEQVGALNLEKTRRLLGEKAFERCKQKNISSCWTDNKKAAKEFSLP